MLRRVRRNARGQSFLFQPNMQQKEPSPAFLYHTNAERFRRIVNRVEARNIPPEKIAELILKTLNARRPRIVYKINRNPMLILLNILPEKTQLRIIRKILMNG